MIVNLQKERRKMTKFDGYIERIEQRRKQRREDELNFELLTSLQTRTKEEVVADMIKGLTFIAGVSNFIQAESAQKHAKELVF